MADLNDSALSEAGGDALQVMIAGAGVAGLEAAFALRELARERIHLTLLAPVQEFVYRPMAVEEPFAAGGAERYPLSKLAAEAGAELIEDALAVVDPERRCVQTAAGNELGYDALFVALGARMDAAFDHATTIDDGRMDELLHGLVQDVEGGYLKRLAVVVPAPPPWPMPAYEIALMTSQRAWDMQMAIEVTVLTPEDGPLAVFGREASLEVARLLAERHVDVVSSAYCEVPTAKKVTIRPSGESLEVDRVVALPALSGPAISGLPHDDHGFIPVDEYGAVRGVDRVWTAGDGCDFPIKLGGLAAQLADTAAQSIAALAGACEMPEPFAPRLEAVLLTGGSPRRITNQPTGGQGIQSELVRITRDAMPPKIAARYLTPHLPGQPVA
jgi:sulfide:quinone oxidoreductase